MWPTAGAVAAVTVVVDAVVAGTVVVAAVVVLADAPGPRLEQAHSVSAARTVSDLRSLVTWPT
jgi:hypothetical protein